MSKLAKCKNCTGGLIYSPEKNMLVCEWCGSGFNFKEKRGREIKRAYDPSFVPQENLANETTYVCSSCGVKCLEGTDNVVYRCSSCGNTTLKKESSILNLPDGIIPFKIDKHKAGEIFKKWVATRKFAPNDLVQMAKLEKLSGFYVPVWSFSYTSLFRYSLVGIKKSLDSYDREVRKEYMIQKMLEDKVENEIYSATTKISDDLITSVGKFDVSDVRPYSIDYLLGFAGLDTDKDVHKLYNNICKITNNKKENEVKNKLEETYDYLEDFTSVTKLRDVSYYHTYVPLWANYYTY